MKALEISAAIRAQFEADGDFSGVTMFDDVGSGAMVRPCLIFDVHTKSLNGIGSALAWTLTVWIESIAEKKAESDPDPITAYKALTALVHAKLFGTGKSALLSALNTAGIFAWRGWSASESDPGIEAHHFRTPLAAAGTVLVL